MMPRIWFLEKPAARRSEWLEHSGRRSAAHVSKLDGGSKRQTLTRPCDAARVELDELLHEKANDQLGVGGEVKFVLARWCCELGEAHGSQLHRWVGGAQVVHVRMRTSHCSNLVVSSLCCSWCIMGSSFKCSGSSGGVMYLASRDIVRLLPSRAGGGRRERGPKVYSVIAVYLSLYEPNDCPHARAPRGDYGAGWAKLGSRAQS